MTEIYCGIIIKRYLSADIMADILRQIYIYIYDGIYIYITAIVLMQIYYGRYITTDILQQICYGRYIMADMLRPINITVAMSQPISSAKSSRLLRLRCSFQSIATRTPKDRFIYTKAAKRKPTTSRHLDFGEVDTVKPETPPPGYILGRQVFSDNFVKSRKGGWLGGSSPDFHTPKLKIFK